ncbi:MAG TPA: zeta toxin family protein [Bryobacteraceae bacterium]|nr:zeta toxin family protein [Bryobacteraceae bacterium]
MSPRIFVVAGPPGGGKSTAFPVSGFGVDFFNADDHASSLNQGSYLDIPRNIRDQVNRLFEAFVLEHIKRGASCAFETTLRSEITFAQVALARRAGFTVEMRYVALSTFAAHLERVKMRADKGGHSAPEPVLRSIFEASIRHLPRAIREMDFIHVYDNSVWGGAPTVILQAESAEIIYLAEEVPAWLKGVLEQI